MACTRRVPETQQLSFSSVEAMKQQEAPPSSKSLSNPIPEFDNPSGEHIFIGDEPLKKYLGDNEMGWVVRLGELIAQSDLSGFVSAYQRTGRRAIHPRIMLSLIVYGILLGQWSLRALEKLARRDVGAWWLCGGMQPDHSTIGKFIALHAEVLTEEYFVSLTRMLLKRLKIPAGDVAGDGTVIEACGSRLRTLKAEAAQQAAAEAAHEAAHNPGDEKAFQQAHTLQQAVEALQERQQKVAYKGQEQQEKVQVCITEPEAVVQIQKDKTYRPSYKPSVCANSERFILGQALHPSSETAVVRDMVGQHQHILGRLPDGMMMDAAYNTFEVLAMAAEMSIDLLCPTGNVEGSGNWQKEVAEGTIPKRDFHYDEDSDTYRCPGGHTLHFLDQGTDHHNRAYRRYQCTEAEHCPLRERCTRSLRGRRVTRYADEPLKEAMAQVLTHPKAREKYRRRQWMVEPVFSVLRYRQGLQRFHRRGLRNVKVEFALHCVAYNLGRAVALISLDRQRDQSVGLFFFCCHHKGIIRFLLFAIRT